MRSLLLLAVLSTARQLTGQTPAVAPAAVPSTPMTLQQSVTVTADRGLANLTDTATSVAVLDAGQLLRIPALTLDDRLRTVDGFQLFRRTSSWTANPTTQGVSLRGLGSTAASRTLVVSDQVPLNEPFGGWIHWDEIPNLAIAQVALLRGGSSDLYGSSAIGGVVDITPVQPTAPTGFQLSADASGATQSTGLGDALLAFATPYVNTLGAFSALSTGGYIPTAPAFRGLVDTPANVSSQSGRLELRTPHGTPVSAFLLGNVLNESRANGTPDQTNATRLWRYSGGLTGDNPLGHAELRAFGSRESYRQSFSSVAANRDSEKLTRLQQVPTDEFGFVAQGAHSFLPNLTASLGVDDRDIRATDNELSTFTGVTTSTNARQREVGGYADALWQPGRWSVSGSVRVDSFRTFDGVQVASGSAVVKPQPELAELFASPRAGLVRQFDRGLSLSANGFRAFRGPTLNELYRTGQVGQQTTLANNTLHSERATGFELGGEWTRPGLGHLRASYFWTEVNRPISAVLLSQTATAQTLERQNLGQIRSRGLMIEAQSERRHGFDASVGYQLADATVTAFNSASPAQANLTGKWIPQVPREALIVTGNYSAPRIATLHLVANYTGRQFDDAANQFLLHPFARFDLSADRSLSHGLFVFASAQNLLDRTIDAGRTPILTLASRRLVQAGLRYSFSR